MRVHHVGYLVKNMKKAEDQFTALGYAVESEAVYDADREVDIAFYINGGYRVELICPQKQSPIYPLLQRYKNSPYHICYSCDDIQAAMAELEGQGFGVFQPPAKADAMGGKPVAFMMGRGIGMIELYEE